MSRTRTTGTALIALAIVGGLAACGDDDTGSPTLAELQASASANPSPSGDLSPEEQEKQKILDEAEEFLAEALQAEVDAMQGGFTDWPGLANEYWGGELAQDLVPLYQEMSAKKWYTTGAPELVSSEVTDYVAEDVGYEQVEFTTCVDRTSQTVHKKGGAEASAPMAGGERFVNVYRVEHQGEGKSWRVTESRSEGESC